MPPEIGILAGGGILPRRLAEAAASEKRKVFIVAFKGQADPATVEGFDHVWVRLGAAGEAIKALKNAGCRELVMAGHVRRPSLVELRPDWRAACLFAKTGLSALGDYGLLKAVRSELESEGFRLVAPQDVMRGLLMPPGNLSKAIPGKQAEIDINKGIAVLKVLAPLDVGQAVVVQQGLVLGIEAIEGTASLLRRVRDYRREGQGGVLVKLSKAQQDTSLDLPTIGPDTIEQAHAAGLSGLAVEAGRALFLDSARTLARCD